MPVIAKAECKLNQRDQIKQKLDEKALTPDDWQTIAGDRVLAVTVLDDIVKKYHDYRTLSLRQKRHASALAVTEPDKKNESGMATQLVRHHSRASVDSAKAKKEEAQAFRPIEKARLRRQINDQLTVIATFDKAGMISHAGKVDLQK